MAFAAASQPEEERGRQATPSSRVRQGAYSPESNRNFSRVSSRNSEPAVCYPSAGLLGKRLLSSMAEGGAEALNFSMLTVDHKGEKQTFDNMRLTDVCSKLWPSEDRSSDLCRALRFLGDFTKRDFLLRPARYGYLLRVDFARALIEPTRVIFLGIDNTTFQAFLGEFVQMIQAGIQEGSAFDLWAVESVVCANVTMHEMRLQVMRPVIDSILNAVELRASESLILKLYPLKVSISKFIEQVRPLVMCLRGLLHTENEYSAGALDSFTAFNLNSADEPAESPRHQAAPAPLHRSSSIKSVRSMVRKTSSRSSSLSDTKGFEDLVETWAHNAQEVMADAIELSTNIDDAAHFSEASLSYLRTRLLLMELVAMTLTLAMTFGALVAGIFGMNLKSGLEDKNGWFVGVVVCVLAVSVAIVLSLFGLYRRGKIHYRSNCARYGNNMFFRHIEDDRYVLQALEGGFGSILEDLQTPVAPLQPGTARRPLAVLGGLPEGRVPAWAAAAAPAGRTWPGDGWLRSSSDSMLERVHSSGAPASPSLPRSAGRSAAGRTSEGAPNQGVPRVPASPAMPRGPGRSAGAPVGSSSASASRGASRGADPRELHGRLLS